MGVGANRDKYVPSPGAAVSMAPGRAVSMAPLYEFVGTLMACSLRTGVKLPLELPSSFWKPLVGASLTDADLEAFDINAHESLNVIATLRAEEFSHTIFESFTVMR